MSNKGNKDKIQKESRPLSIRVNRQNIEKPVYYNSHPSGIEAISITQRRDFNMGNVIKYIWRAGLKNEHGLSTKAKQLEDLNKALVYLGFELSYLKELKKELGAKGTFKKLYIRLLPIKEDNKMKDLIIHHYSNYCMMALDSIWNVGLYTDYDLANFKSTEYKLKAAIRHLEKSIIEIENSK